MKKAIAIIVFLSLFAQCIVQLGILGYYELNKDYIAKNLCENRDKPQMKCCGKCYLHKQLKKAEGNSSSKNLPDKTEKSEVVAYILPVVPSFSLINYHPFISVQNPVSQHLHGADIALAVFHPPSVVC